MAQKGDPNYIKYRNFVKHFEKANTHLKRETLWKEANLVWNRIKVEGDERIEQEILRLREKAAARETKLLGFWSSLSSNQPKRKRLEEIPSTTSTETAKDGKNSTVTSSTTEELDLSDEKSNETKTPAQHKCLEKIGQLNKKITSLTCKFNY